MKKFALVLSGGSAKGYAHIGVLKVLEKYNLKPSLVVGTSMGALVGGMYASGKSIDQMIQLGYNFKSIGNFSLSGTIFRGHTIHAGKINKLLMRELGDFRQQDCQIPFIAVATNLNTGKETALSTGILRQNIRASISIPAMFEIAYIDGIPYVDGGLCNNLPEDVAKRLMPDAEIISVDCIGDYQDNVETLLPKILQNLLNVSTIMTQNIVKLKPNVASLRLVVSQPEISQLDFNRKKVDSAVKNGERVAEENIGKIINILKED